MPTYDYRCDTNGQVVEVSHRMNETITQWGELCARAGVEPGETPTDSPVHRLATGATSSPRPAWVAAWRRLLVAAVAAAPRGCAA
jgi:hypothetical protein